MSAERPTGLSYISGAAVIKSEQQDYGNAFMALFNLGVRYSVLQTSVDALQQAIHKQYQWGLELIDATLISHNSKSDLALRMRIREMCTATSFIQEEVTTLLQALRCLLQQLGPRHLQSCEAFFAHIHDSISRSLWSSQGICGRLCSEALDIPGEQTSTKIDRVQTICVENDSRCLFGKATTSHISESSCDSGGSPCVASNSV